jgi:hypothetical protein
MQTSPSIKVEAQKLVEKVISQITERQPSNNEFALRDFTPNDRTGYGGAEDGPDGESPMLGEVSLDGLDGTVIVHRNGVEVILSNQDANEMQDDPTSYFFETPFSQAKGIAHEVSRMTTLRELIDYGFKRR